MMSQSPTPSVEVEVGSNTERETEIESENEVEVDDGLIKRRKTRSEVWDEFEKKHLGAGKIRATCHHCKKFFDGSSKNGTTHLRNHLKTCSRRPQNRLSQRLITSVTSGGKPPRMGTWKFDAAKSRIAFAKMVAFHDYPFNMAEHRYFQEYVKTIDPRIKFYSRNTIRADVKKVYDAMRVQLQATLERNTSRVSLTTDLWTAEHQNLGYCCVTCHFLDDDWVLHKKIIAFGMIPSPHTGIILSEFIKSTTLAWNIDSKLFAVAVDNASSNDVMIRNLKEWMNDKGVLLLNGDMFHMRCSAHVLNLIVQDGLKVVGSLVGKIRESVTFIKSSQGRKQKFESALVQTKLTGKGVSSDVPTRWNSTFHMLESAIEVKSAFFRLAELHSEYKTLPSKEEWERGAVICECLRVFNNITLLFSGVKYPTANLYFKGVLDVNVCILDWLNSPHDYVRSMAQNMKEKFDKYWKSCSLMMTIGTIIDPRYKFKFVQFAFSKIYGNDSTTYSNQVLSSLRELYSSYAMQAGPDIFSQDSFVGTSTSSSGIFGNIGLKSKLESEFDNLHKNMSQSNEKSELEKYLDEPLFPKGDDPRSFDILAWWKLKAPSYPILATMARDLLAVPVSTVASESAFSCSGRVVTPHRSSLAPDIVESLSCVKNWLPPLSDDVISLEEGSEICDATSVI
ncbi:zinc finger BED domain-containing protein RICESLEEPER 2-like [Iris pallida]|uniref:Zinc finger BED domain-containing protein RICESLEEPER 2-like n=1 Tax=Iris pallida TaxID=29817 RepID=A0AAX6GC28_IRIPA|nr:zinc finger BED domain-containing protein RICESLEEPER 2-like [Iris pallida]